MTRFVTGCWSGVCSDHRAALLCTAARRPGERGAELVELALVLPLLLVVIAGIIDFGLLFQRYEVVTNAAREGARIAILPGYDSSDVQSRVNQYVDTGINASASSSTTVNVTPGELGPGNGGPNPPIQTVTVTVSYTTSYLILGPMVSLIGGNGGNFGTVTLTAASTMRVES